MYPFVVVGGAAEGERELETSHHQITITQANPSPRPRVRKHTSNSPGIAVRHHPHGRHSATRRCAHMSRDPSGERSLQETQCGGSVTCPKSREAPGIAGRVPGGGQGEEGWGGARRGEEEEEDDGEEDGREKEPYVVAGPPGRRSRPHDDRRRSYLRGALDLVAGAVTAVPGRATEREEVLRSEGGSHQ
jgi:hypothetical protein